MVWVFWKIFCKVGAHLRYETCGEEIWKWHVEGSPIVPVSEDIKEVEQ